MPQYLAAAKSDAKRMAEYLLDAIVEQCIAGHASDSYANDYDGGDEYHHEHNVDRRYSLTEADALLDELAEYEETDAGLWAGDPPRKAIEIQARFTYGGAVDFLWRDVIKAINESGEVENAVAEVENIDRYLDGLLETLAEGEDPAEVRAKVLERREAAVTTLTEAVKAVINNF